jgi:hypothetical protein
VTFGWAEFPVVGSVSLTTDDVEPRIDFFHALLHSPVADEVTYWLWIAILLGAVAGLVLRRWWHGVIAIMFILAAYLTFLVFLPVVALDVSFELPTLREIGRPTRTVFFVLAVALVLAFSLRWVAVRSWHWIVGQPRSA